MDALRESTYFEDRQLQWSPSVDIARVTHPEEGALRTVFEHISDGLLMVDRSGVILRSNQAALKVLDRAFLNGAHLADVFKADAELSMLLLDGTKHSAQLTLASHEDSNRVDVISASEAGGDIEYWLIKPTQLSDAHHEQIYYRATRDHLTGLYNRSVFEDELHRRLVEATRGDRKGALLWMDLDGFKRVNDSLGHLSGDLMLTMVATFLQNTVRSNELLARVGGDEFAIIMPDSDSIDTRRTANRIVREFRRSRFSISGQTIDIGISIGAVLFPAGGNNVTTLIANADAAMYLAKSGRRGYVMHGEEASAFDGSVGSKVTQL